MKTTKIKNHFEMKSDLNKLKDRLLKIEIELNKCRTSTIADGWQTQRYAKKARKWDYFAQEKMKIIQKIEEYESN